MSNSKDNEEKTSSKSSFNKSKSISSAMDDLEMGRPISKAVSDFEIDSSTLSSDLEEKSSSNSDLEIISEVEESNSKKSSYDDLSSFLEEDDEDDGLSSVLDDEKDEYDDLSSFLEGDDEKDEEVIVSSVEEEPNNLDIDKGITFTPEEKEVCSLLEDEDLILSRPAKKSSNSSKSFGSFSDKFNFIKNNRGIFKGIKLSTKSKILSLLGLIIGLFFIVYGIMNFSNVSDRVIDHVLLGETGSWSIVLIFMGLIIVLLDVFYVFYYKSSLNNSNIKNAQIRSTFDAIDKIKSIDKDYYDKSDDSDSIFDNILKLDKESSKNDLKNSTFKEEEIYVDHIARELDELDFKESDGLDSDYFDVSDSYDKDSIDYENSIFENESEELSNPVDDDLVIIPEVEESNSKKSSYDDLSSFLYEDEEEILEKPKVKKDTEIDSIVKESPKAKSTKDEDLAAKKARIIEGTNFDNSLRKSK